MCAGTSLASTLGAPPWAVAGMAAAWLAAVGGLALRPVHFRPDKFRVPLSPLTPAAAILATVHLIGAGHASGCRVLTLQGFWD